MLYRWLGIWTTVKAVIRLHVNSIYYYFFNQLLYSVGQKLQEIEIPFSHRLPYSPIKLFHFPPSSEIRFREFFLCSNCYVNLSIQSVAEQSIRKPVASSAWRIRRGFEDRSLPSALRHNLSENDKWKTNWQDDRCPSIIITYVVLIQLSPLFFSLKCDQLLISCFH